MARRSLSLETDHYLEAVSLKIYSYVAFTDYYAKEPLVETSSAERRARLNDLEQYVTAQRSDEVLPPSAPLLLDPSVEESGVVDPLDNRFVETVTLMQRDIVDLIGDHGEKIDPDEHPSLLQLTSAPLPELVLSFQTSSRAWDCLGECKKRLCVPDVQGNSIAQWHITIMSEAERFLREIISLTVLHFGDRFLRSAVVGIMDELKVSFAVEDVLKAESGRDAVAQVLLSYMRQGSNETLRVAGLLASRLQMQFLPDSPGFVPGVIQFLPWVTDTPPVNGKSVATMFGTLFDWRRQIIHASLLESRPKRYKKNLELYRERRTPELSMLAQFVSGVSLNYALSIISKILSQAKEGTTPKRNVENRESKLSAELRLLHLDLLESRLWGLSWILGEAIQMIGEPGRQEMPRLNSLFARTQMGTRIAPSARRELEQLELSEDRPRYELMKKSILGEFRGIDKILDRAISGRDLSLKELHEWPVLEGLRRSAEYKQWYRKITDPGSR